MVRAESAPAVSLREPFAPRPVRCIDMWTVGDWRLKVYTITHGKARADQGLVDATREQVQRYLGSVRDRHTTYRVGFVGIHDGRGENQVFLSRWSNENELLHAIWISSKDRPAELRPGPPDQNVACVWDLAVMCHERSAWIEEVLQRPDATALDRYLDRRMNADV